MKPKQIALIGCGGAARWHAKCLLNSGEASIVGLVDPSTVSMERIRGRYRELVSVPGFADMDSLFEAVDLDAVVVATPHTLHYQQVKAALERGLHVLCEKPLACEAAHARELAALANAAGLTLMIAYQRRLDPVYCYLRRLIVDGALGELQAISIVGGQNWQQLNVADWRQQPDLSGGGMMMDSGSHLIDVLLWLVDQPVLTVSALVDTCGQAVDINCAALLQFAGGVQGHLSLVGNLAGAWFESVTVSGTQGFARYEIDPQHPWRTGRLAVYYDQSIVQPLITTGETTVVATWLDVLQGRRTNPAPAASGVRIADVTQAMYRSAQEQASVVLGGIVN